MIKKLVKYFQRKFTYRRLKVVYDDDLEQLLDSLEVLEQFKGGDIRCSQCDCKMTLENFGALWRDKDSIEFLCNQPSCHG